MFYLDPTDEGSLVLPSCTHQSSFLMTVVASVGPSSLRLCFLGYCVGCVHGVNPHVFGNWRSWVQLPDQKLSGCEVFVFNAVSRLGWG